MNTDYTGFGVIGGVLSTIWVRPEAVVEGIVVAAAGTLTALFVRWVWGFAGDKISDKRNGTKKD